MENWYLGTVPKGMDVVSDKVDLANLANRVPHHRDLHSRLRDKQMASASAVFLTFNDVYVLSPDDDGCGGIAEFATLLSHVKATIPSETRVIVTLNGDFLWRSELDRKDKGSLMIEVLNHLGVEFVVLGNHEFDFGEDTLQALLKNANFSAFGSNIRLRKSQALLKHTTDTRIIELADSMRLGIFGVCTVTTATDSFATESVVFESEVVHAKRCVDVLKSLGADVIVALTHMTLPVDKLLAKHVPEIDLILGGHDHEPISLFQGSTFIHKSGQDALWLGKVHLNIRKSRDDNRFPLAFQWEMFSNRGYTPDPDCAKILREYTDRVELELTSSRLNEVLATSRTLLDGTRITCRSRECNLGNLIADAIRDESRADVAFINGGYIRGERLHNVGLKITRAWLSEVLSYPNPTSVIEMCVADFHTAMLKLFSKYPDLSPSFPHISGVFVVCDIRDDNNRLLRLYRDPNHTREIGLDDKITVATSSFVVDEMEGFRNGNVLIENGPTIPDVVTRFLQLRQTIAYPLQERRITFME